MMIMFEIMKMINTINYMPEIQYLSDTSHFITQGGIQIQIEMLCAAIGTYSS